MDITLTPSPPAYSTATLLLCQQGLAVGEGLFPSAARFNHSCEPLVRSCVEPCEPLSSYILLSSYPRMMIQVGLSFDSWGCLVATAGQEIARGEELLISYVGVSGQHRAESAAAADDSSVAKASEGAEHPTGHQRPRRLRAGTSASGSGPIHSIDLLERGQHGVHIEPLTALGEGDVWSAREARRARLSGTYLFDCDCSLCSRGQ